MPWTRTAPATENAPGVAAISIQGWVHEGGRQGAIQARDSHQHISDARLQTGEFNAFSHESCGAGINQLALDRLAEASLN